MHLSFFFCCACVDRNLNFNCGLKCLNNWVVGAINEVRCIEYRDTSSNGKTHYEHAQTSSPTSMLSCSNHMKLTPLTSPNKSKTSAMSPHYI
jgi:hypothetical protein